MSVDELDRDYLNEMRDLLKDEFEEYLEIFQKKPSRGLIFNDLYGKIEDFIKNFEFPIEKIPYADNGYYLDSEEKVGNLPLHIAGAFYMQEPSAMAPVCCMIKVNGFILDMCSAPGGKTIQLALKNKDSIIVANEVNRARCKVLISNIERLGLKNVFVSCLTTDELEKYFSNFFDAVIVDAPCSGEGMFRKEKIAVSQWTKDYTLTCSHWQKEILKNANACLKNGGLLLYSTCTFSVVEDEENLDYLMNNYNFEKVDTKKYQGFSDGIIYNGKDYSFANRLYPHKLRGEGQFFALVRKVGQVSVDSYSNFDSKLKKIQKNSKNLKIFDDFIQKNVNIEENFEIFERGNVLFGVDSLAPFSRFNNFETSGVRLGEIKNGRFEPHHQFFKIFGKNFINFINFSLNDENLYKYLHGEAISLENFSEIKEGFCAVLVQGYPLGGAKCTGGRLNNLFPKGLRMENLKKN